jgi:hypothetical protein
MQKLSEQVKEQAELLVISRDGSNTFSNVLNIAKLVADRGAEQCIEVKDIMVPLCDEELRGETPPVEIRILRIFQGLRINLPTTREDLHHAFIAAEDYYRELMSNPIPLEQCVLIHDVFRENIDNYEEFPLESIFLIDMGEDSGGTEITYPYLMVFHKYFFGTNEEEVVYKRVNTVIHELVHRYRLIKKLIPMNVLERKAQFENIEDGLSGYVAGKICEFMGVKQINNTNQINTIVSSKIGSLLEGMTLKEIANITMDELEKRAGKPLEEVEDEMQVEIDAIEEENL